VPILSNPVSEICMLEASTMNNIIKSLTKSSKYEYMSIISANGCSKLETCTQDMLQRSRSDSSLLVVLLYTWEQNSCDKQCVCLNAEKWTITKWHWKKTKSRGKQLVHLRWTQVSYHVFLLGITYVVAVAVEMTAGWWVPGQPGCSAAERQWRCSWSTGDSSRKPVAFAD